MNFLQMLKGIKNPKEAAMKMMRENATNPIMKNLIAMAEKEDNKGIEKFARNLFKEQGKDFDKEFENFMKNFK